MRALLPLLPVFNHRLGLAYVASVLRDAGHEVIPIDFEHILRMCDPQLSLDLQDRTEVYADGWSRQIQYFHRPELLFAALYDDAALDAALGDDDRELLARLRPHVRQWCETILAFDPEVVLFPSLVSNLWIVLWLAQAIGSAAPGVIRVLGGRGVTYPEVGELVLRAGWIDGVVTGDAEGSVAPLLAALTMPSRARTAIAACSWMDGDRYVSRPAEARVDLDSLPLPDLAGLPFPGASLRLYGDVGRDFHDAVSLATSRWCPYRCAYCYESIAPKTYRLRTLDAVMREIDAQHDRYGTPRLFFCDSTLNVSPAWLRSLAERMAQLSWTPQVVFAHCEPTRLTADVLLAMRAAGFEKLNFGVESLDPRTLARMDRRPRVGEMTAVFTAAVQSGVSLGLNLIANYPGTSEEEFRVTLAGTAALAERLRGVAAAGVGVRLMVSQARIDPHSSLFVNHARHGVRIMPRRLAVPAVLAHLRPLIEPLSLEWTDGTPERDRRARFRLLRTYAESLSWPARPTARRSGEDRRASIDWARVPPQIASLIATATARTPGATPAATATVMATAAAVDALAGGAA
jgi:hypothetical protein